MADLLFNVCAAASVANTVAILGKTLVELQSLQTQLSGIGFTFIDLISDLTALKTALNTCKEWMDTDVNELDHHLLADLEPLVICCRMLARRIHSEIQTLQQNKGTALDSEKKAKSLVKNSSFKELQKIVRHQMSALTVFRAVSECNSNIQQNTILGRLSTRKTFIQVEDDISWLHGERKSTSICSFDTISWSRVFKKIRSLREPFLSMIYENPPLYWCRRTVGQLCRARQPCVIATRQEWIRNKLIERELEEHAEYLRKEAKVVMLGGRECDQIFMKSMQMAVFGGFTFKQRMDYKRIIGRIVTGLMRSMAWIIKEGNFELNENAKMHAKVLFRVTEKMDCRNEKITAEGAGAVQGLWEDKVIVQSVLESVRDIAKLPPAFIEDLQKITSDDYLPTDADILRLGNASPVGLGIEEYKFEMYSLSFRVFDIHGGRGERRKWIHLFENPASVIFIVDLSNYGEVFPEDPDLNTLSETIALFDNVANSRWFSNTSIILMLCNFGLFKEQLENQAPRYFPDYNGGYDVQDFSKYLLWKFNQLNRAGLTLYPHFCEPSDISNTRAVCRDVKEIMSHRLHSSRNWI